MDLVAVGIGGFFGAVLRYQLGQWMPSAHGLPIRTLIINLLGCLFLAWFFTITVKRWNIPSRLRLGIGTGFTGAFTTFSTFSMETTNLISHGQASLAIMYVLFSVIGGVVLALFGTKIAAQSVFKPVKRTGEGD